MVKPLGLVELESVYHKAHEETLWSNLVGKLDHFVCLRGIAGDRTRQD
jgi:hypothetical protein